MKDCKPSELDDFLFDLRGYLILRQAVSSKLIDDLNAAFDAFPDIEPGEWFGNAKRAGSPASKDTQYLLHNCVEAGKPFEELIDHPSWIEYVARYCGEDDSWTNGLFIDECHAIIRKTAGRSGMHSGGYRAPLRTIYSYKNGVFRCGQVNMLLALTDIGPGDGPTIVMPGSHKSNIEYPSRAAYSSGDKIGEMDDATPAYLDRGDALLFVDSLIHGASSRTNPGERRVVLYRYGPMWGATRLGYEYSEPLLNRLTPERRKILQPVTPQRPPSPSSQ